METLEKYKKVRQLPQEVARKIAAGEVIDRPCAIVRELMDNAVDSGAKSITVEIDDGGIDRIRIVDDGIGMTKEDLTNCARPHATSKIETEADLLNLSTLGFRGEALSSIAAVSLLEITSCRNLEAWKLTASVTSDHLIEPASLAQGTIVQSSSLFENFPARRVFLKRPTAEATLCKQTFIEKALPRTDISFRLFTDGKKRLDLPAGQSLAERFATACDISEPVSLLNELSGFSNETDNSWSYKLIIGDTSVSRSDRRNISIYVNGRKINEYSLIQAIEYGAQGYFPNGTHPVACLFLQMNPAVVDFNIHPAKREARFKDISAVHHSVSTTVRSFFHNQTVQSMLNTCQSISQNDAQTENTDYTISQPKSDFRQKFFSDCFSDEAPTTPPTRDLNFNDTPTRDLFANDTHTKDLHTNTQLVNTSLGELTYQVNGSQQIGRAHQDGASCKIGTNHQSDITHHIYQEEVTEEIPNYITSQETTSLSTDYTSGNIHYIGSALGVFLLAEKDDILYAIDQHAAHERILFNKIMESNGRKQQLLVPYVIETLTEDDDKYLSTVEPKLAEAGFDIKNCGDGRWEVYSVPVNWQGTEKDLSCDILENKLTPNEIVRSICATAACRAAIKDGGILDRSTAEQLVRDTFALPEKRCPHGRPVMTSFSREELFHLVQRT